MAVNLSSEVKVSILIGDEEVHAFFPGYPDSDFIEAQKKLLSSRFDTQRGTPRDKSQEARIRFFNTTCLRVENVEHEGKPLTPEVADWRGKIPVGWKVSFSLFFEEKSTLSEEDVGN